MFKNAIFFVVLSFPGFSASLSPENTAVSDTEKIEATEDHNRPDVAGFQKKPVVFFLPFWKELEAIHPVAEGGDKDKNVIVVDLDELAATGSGSGSGGAVIGHTILLDGAGILAFYYGTRTSIETIIESTKEIKELKEQKK